MHFLFSEIKPDKMNEHPGMTQNAKFTPLNAGVRPPFRVVPEIAVQQVQFKDLSVPTTVSTLPRIVIESVEVHENKQLNSEVVACVCVRCCMQVCVCVCVYVRMGSLMQMT